MEDNDAHLELKKRARRRLVGAVAFAGFAAVVLPMVMDQEPKEETQDVEIRIPGQDEKPFAPKFASAPAAKPAAAEAAAGTKAPAGVKPAEPAKPGPEAALSRPAEEAAKAGDRSAGKSAANEPEKRPPEKSLPAKAPEAPPKAADKTATSLAAKPAEKAQPTSRAAEPVTDSDSRRAAAILAGKAPEAAPAGGQFVILIGAYSNPANVRNLQSKLGELGLKVYTEPLDTPQGRKTRVRAGPFANRDAAEKALDRMKRIGVPGVLSPRQ